MHLSRAVYPRPLAVETAVQDLMACVHAGEDPRRTIARLDRMIVDCQQSGADVPSGYLRLSRTLAQRCVAQARRS